MTLIRMTKIKTSKTIEKVERSKHMILGPVKKEWVIRTCPPIKCGLTALTADSIVKSKLASEEGFNRIVFMLLLVILINMIFCNK